MSTVTITQTRPSVTVTSAGAVTVTRSAPSVELRGGLVGPSPTNLDTSTGTGVALEVNDVLVYSASTAQFEPARLSIVGGAIVYTFLADLAYPDGGLWFD